MYRSMQEETSALREAAVRTASEKWVDQLQPPSEIMTLRPGCLAFSSRSWLKLPASGWVSVSATPSTDPAASSGRA
ncbi:hypothetical protein SCALM49S_04450 [Streptomyces californicus]